MDARELDRECRTVWAQIAHETGSWKAHAKKVARLFNVCRDIQQAIVEGRGLWTVRPLLTLLCRVAERSAGMPLRA